MGPHSSECGNVVILPREVHIVEGLQWGRTHLSAETRSGAAHPDRDIGRLQWGRTHLSAETPERWGIIDVRLPASMGPHSSECGNELNRKSMPQYQISLQWGRTHLSAETVCVEQHCDDCDCASMGPHSSECGNAPAEGDGGPRGGASMGPHSSECGNERHPGAPRSARRRFNGAALI